MRLLLIEDERRLADLVRQGLSQAGFVVDAAPGCRDGWAMLCTVPYDAVILDLGLPDGDGIDLLGRLRSAGHSLPLLILTARDALASRVAGLNHGADDYLVKPFEMSELVARLHALLRRTGGLLGAKLSAGALIFDTVGRDAYVGAQALSLPRREAGILEHLLRRQGRVVPKAVLEEKLYGFDDELESNAIPVHVHHLRRRLAEANAGVAIHTVRGVGYMLQGGAP